MPLSEKSQNKSQLERFKEAAKQVETNDSEEAFDRTLKKVAKPSSDRAATAKKAGRG
jgi:hypothetical protein